MDRGSRGRRGRSPCCLVASSKRRRLARLITGGEDQAVLLDARRRGRSAGAPLPPAERWGLAPAQWWPAGPAAGDALCAPCRRRSPLCRSCRRPAFWESRDRGDTWTRCRLQGTESALCSRSLTRTAEVPLRAGFRPRAGAASECADQWLEPPTERGETVLDRGRPGVEHSPLEQARVDELCEAHGEGCGRDATEGVAELVEPLGPFDRGVEDRQRPASLEEVRRAADLLGDRFRPPATHGPAPARARARAPRRC